MKMFDLECPICGAMNFNLYLEESGGWMECNCCHQLVRDANFNKTAGVSNSMYQPEPSAMSQHIAF